MNKYEIYTPQEELFKYIEDNQIPNKKLFKEQDFIYVYPDKGFTFFDERELINGYSFFNIPDELKDFQQVTPEEFLIAIGYLPKKPSVSPIKAEDIHYICEIDNGDRLCVEVFAGKAYVKVGGIYSGGSRLVELSPEGLIELGSDLVRLGVALRDGTYQE